MKRIPAHVALVLLVFALVLPGFVIAQSTNPGTNPAGRRSRGGPTAQTAAVERDFSEALKMIEEQYVDGKKLNYNDVFKSSIIGMLRSLDPHSNYYDRSTWGSALPLAPQSSDEP